MTVVAQAGTLSCIVWTRMPTRYAVFQFYGLERDVESDQVETALAIVLGDPTEGAPLLRVHSQCFTGEVLSSRRRDCNDQLEMAVRAVAEEGRGLIIYDEGRGIGLMAKLQTYELQDAGLDTVEANHAPGFSRPAAIFCHLGIRRVRLLTNNPRKTQALLSAGIVVVAEVHCEVAPTPYSFSYLQTKKTKTRTRTKSPTARSKSCDKR